MSNEKQVTKKTVKINENDLVDLIDNIVKEAVTVAKQGWISEQAKKGADKTTVLEGKLADLEAIVNRLTEGKK